MPILRVPLIAGVAGRNSAPVKDSKMVNAFSEKTRSGKLLAVKRPGLEEVFPHNGTLGQGVHSRVGTYTIVDGTLIDEASSATYPLATDSELYTFLTTPVAVLPGFLVKSNKKLFYFEE